MGKRKYKRLHYEDRQTIEAMSKQGSSVSDIAEALGTHRDTIYREFKRCNATLKTYTADYVGQQCCIDIVTSNMSLFGATWNLTKEDSENQTERYKRFADIMGGFYDYCIIDNPPDIGLNVVNYSCLRDWHRGL